MASLRTTACYARQLLASTARGSSRAMLLRSPASVRALSGLAPTASHISRKDQSSALTGSTMFVEKMGFATSLSYADFTKQDSAMDEAQEYMEEGVSFLNNDMIPMAMSCFQRSLNVRPTAAAHYNMGIGYFQLGDFQSSIKAFQESLKLAPHHADVHTNLATAHIKHDGNMAEALRHLQAAANISSQDPEIQFNLAVISEQNGDFDGAIKAYQAALDLGIEKAEMNLRNVKTKKFAKMAKEIGEAQEKEQPKKNE